MTVLFRRGGDQSRQLKWGGVQLKTDSSGATYLEFNEQLTKTKDGEPSRKAGLSTPKPLKIFGNPQICPIQAYKLLLARRPADMLHDGSPFF